MVLRPEIRNLNNAEKHKMFGWKLGWWASEWDTLPKINLAESHVSLVILVFIVLELKTPIHMTPAFWVYFWGLWIWKKKNYHLFSMQLLIKQARKSSIFDKI